MLKLSSWCEERNISIQAVFLPGSSNIVADAESRRPSTIGDWVLSKVAFSKIPEAWAPKVNLFASSWNAQLPTFVSRFPQPGAWMTDAFSLNWKFVREYAPPPLQHHRRMPGQGDPGPSDSCDGDSLLAQPNLVTGPLGAVHRRTTDVLPGAGPADFPVGRTSPDNHQPVPPPDRLEAIGICLLSQGFSGNVIGLLLSATRENTNSAYQSAWSHWCNWCHAR